MSKLRNAALSYARAGSPVFPCRAGTKFPATAHGFKDATTHLGVVADWWARDPNANIGYAIEEGCVIIDVDPQNGGGVPTVLNTKTRTVRTPNGGYHLYFKVPPDARLVGRWPGKPGVDVKKGGKGYVLLPPSEVVTMHGVRKYELVGDETYVRSLPDPVLELLTKVERTRDVVVGHRRFFPWETGSAPGLAYLAKALATLAEAQEGTRNNTLFRVTASLLNLVEQGDLDEDATLERVRDTALGTGLEYDEVMAAMHSAYESRDPR